MGKLKKRVVLFDFVDTLAILVPPRAETLRNIIKDSTELNFELDQILDAYRATDETLQYSSIKSELDSNYRRCFYEDYNRQLLGCLGLLHLIQPRNIFQLFSVMERNWILNDGAYQALSSLYALGARIGVLSNFDSNLSDVLTLQLKIGHFIDFVDASVLIGLEKPDPMFYVDCLKRHNIVAEDCIFIGDSLKLDYEPALRLGLNVVLLDQRNKYPSIHNRVKTLTEFVSLITT